MFSSLFSDTSDETRVYAEGENGNKMQRSGGLMDGLGDLHTNWVGGTEAARKTLEKVIFKKQILVF